MARRMLLHQKLTSQKQKSRIRSAELVVFALQK